MNFSLWFLSSCLYLVCEPSATRHQTSFKTSYKWFSSFPLPELLFLASLLRRGGHNTFVLPGCNVFYGSLEMTFGHVNCGGFLVGLEIGVDELDQTIEVFCGDLMQSE